MKFKQFLLEKSKEEEKDELESLASLMRQLAKKQGFYNFDVSVEEDHILVEVVMNKEETFHRLQQLLALVEKIKKDYLTGFDVDMDLWENKKGQPIFTFEYYYRSSSYSSRYDYDDDLPY